jgi:hypothetical protein
VENECKDIVEEPTIAQAKEETTSSLRVRDIGASISLRAFACTDQKKMMVHLEPLGTSGLKEGAAEAV